VEMSLLLGNLRDLIWELPAQDRDPEAGSSSDPRGVGGPAVGGRTGEGSGSPDPDDPARLPRGERTCGGAT